MIVTLQAYRISGEEKSINEALILFRHITWREYKNNELVIIILEKDFELMQMAFEAKTSLGYEKCGSAQMSLSQVATKS